jgi:hypothetical protein
MTFGVMRANFDVHVPLLSQATRGNGTGALMRIGIQYDSVAAAAVVVVV